jgi:hypothetical protein
VGASSTGGGASGRGQESTDIAKAKIKAATHMAAGLNSSPNKGMQGKARVAMVGLVITIAQRKGGAGKTTLATQLAAVWARCGARVAARDIDPQGRFSTWILRILAAKGVSLLLCAPTGRAAKRMTQATGLEDDHPPQPLLQNFPDTTLPRFWRRAAGCRHSSCLAANSTRLSSVQDDPRRNAGLAWPPRI